MTKRLLIDATHLEETRVIIADDQRIHEFDISATTKTQNKGNIYLAKVTRVEPSLQAAFVEYGGGRQGFLPFSEIHPDYYQIPVADRKRLLEEAARELEKAEADEEEQRENPRPEREDRGDRGVRRGRRRGRGRERSRDRGERNDAGAEATPAEPVYDENGNLVEPIVADTPAEEFTAETTDPETAAVETAATETAVVDLPEAQAEVVAVAPVAAEEAEAPAVAEEVVVEKPTPTKRTKAAAAVEPEIAKSDVIEEAELHADAEVKEEAVEIKAEEAAVSASEHDAAEGDNDNEDAAPSNREEGESDIEAASEVETLSDEDDFTRRSKASFLRHYKIQEVIKKNQVILVQVVKEERGNKGASLSTYISLAGRYCVLMPNSPKTGGISRKISSSEDRKRLKEISEDIRTENGMSAIIRTAGIDRTRAEIKRDFDYLLKLWDTIRELTLSSSAPANVYEEADIIKRSLRDLYSADINDIVVAGEDAYKRAKEFMKMMMPSHAARIKLHNENTPIFYAYDVEDQLLRMHEPQVRLESGGSIVINPTEALVSIDVNSGRSTTERNVEETALKTNLEAATEVARQVRLRDLAGLIVIDFIDMFDYKNRRAVERQLKDALKNDRAKIQVGRISAFGLLEMSRQRMRPSLSETNTVSCAHCDGRGFLLSPDATGIQLIRFLEKEAANGNYAHLKLKVPASVAMYLLNHKRSRLLELEQTHGLIVSVEIDDHIVSAAGFILERYNAEGVKTEVNGLDGIPASGGGGNSKRNRNRKRKRDRDFNDNEPRSFSDSDGEDSQDNNESKEEAAQGESGAQEIRTPRREGEEGERSNRRRRGGRRRRGERDGRDREDRDRDGNVPAQSDSGDEPNGNVLPPEAPLPDDAQPTAESETKDAPRKRARGGRRSTKAVASDAPPAFEAPTELVAVDNEGSAEDKPSRRGWWRRMVE